MMGKLRLSALAILVFVALLGGDATAVNIFFGPPSPAGPLAVGETFTVELRMDTEGDAQLNVVGVSVFADPAVFAFVEGTSPGQILFNFDNFSGVAKLGDPFVLASDPDGLVRAANFAAQSPSGIASADELLATLTFEAVGEGTASLDSLLATGDAIASNSVDISDSVTTESSAPITVPEPAPLYMALSALITVLLVRSAPQLTRLRE